MALVFEVEGFSTASDETLLPRGLLFQVPRCLPRFLARSRGCASKTLQPSSPCR
jgi:hypothetical protein